MSFGPRNNEKRKTENCEQKQNSNNSLGGDITHKGLLRIVVHSFVHSETRGIMSFNTLHIMELSVASWANLERRMTYTQEGISQAPIEFPLVQAGIAFSFTWLHKYEKWPFKYKMTSVHWTFCEIMSKPIASISAQGHDSRRTHDLFVGVEL